MPSRVRLPLVAAVGAVVLPLVVLAVVVLVDGAPAPAGDVGLIALRVDDVGGAHTPWLGSYSRFGYNQPGPALLWLLAGPYRLLGARFAGIEVGALAISAVSLAAVVAVAWLRAGSVGAAGTAAVLALFVHALGPAWLVDPWEPHVLVPVGLALLVLAADTVAGRVWSLPLVALSASVVAQAWGTMLVFAVALGGWAVAGVVVAAWRSPDLRRSATRSLGASIAVALVLWAPALVEQAREEPGNLVAMYRTLGADAGEDRLGAADAWRTVALELGHRPTWVGFAQPLDGFSPTADLAAAPVVPLGVVVLGAACGLALVRRHRGAAALGLTVVVGTAAAWLSLAQLIPPVFVWIPQWLRLLGVGVALAAGAAVATVVPRERLRRTTPVLLVGSAVLSAWTILEAVDVDEWRERDRLRDAVATVAVAGARAVADEDGPVLVRSRLDANQALGGQDVAPEVLVAVLERRGVDTVVDRADANRFGPRRARPERARVELRLVSADDEVPAGFEVVATADPLGRDGRRARERLLVDAGLPAGLSDRELLVAVGGDPTLRPVADRLRPYPDLPVVALVVGAAT